MYKKNVKRLIDIFFSFFALIFLSPFLLFIAILVRFFLGSPVIFMQKRPGFYGKPFLIYKFRTMKNTRDNSGKLLSDEKRLTKFGMFLRNFSLDELPELFNVLKGDMSLVGPRPLLMEYLSIYSDEQMKRHEVKPGITGLAQVKGRNCLAWEDKFKFDIQYIDNVNFLMDFKIIMLTLLTLLKREGISADGCVTMTKFKGLE